MTNLCLPHVKHCPAAVAGRVVRAGSPAHGTTMVGVPRAGVILGPAQQLKHVTRDRVAVLRRDEVLDDHVPTGGEHGRWLPGS